MLNPYAPPSKVNVTATGGGLRRTIARLLLVFVGVVFGLHIGLGVTIGFETMARRTLGDPDGMLVASCVVTLASVFAASCYRALRSRLSAVHVSRPLFALPFGVVFGTVAVLTMLGSSELLLWLVGPAVRYSLPTYFDVVLLVPAVIVATIATVEAEQLFARIRDFSGPKGDSDEA